MSTTQKQPVRVWTVIRQSVADKAEDMAERRRASRRWADRRREMREHEALRSTHERSLCGLLLVGIAAIAFFSVRADTWAMWGSQVALGVITAGAALLVGGLLGFLFGIPRTRGMGVGLRRSLAPQRGDGDRRAHVSSRYQPNTNLEQISDWLTKILVGVGLTQIARIQDGFTVLGAALSKGFGGNMGEVFGLTLVVYFVICGFLYGYLWARLNLLTAFMGLDLDWFNKRIYDAEAVSRQAEELSRGVQRRLDDQAESLALVTRQLAATPEDPPIPQQDLNDAVARASGIVRVTIFDQAREQRSQSWNEPGSRSRVDCTIPVFRALVACDDKNHRYFGQLGFALKDQCTPAWADAVTALTTAINLRPADERPIFRRYELCRAICLIHHAPDFDKRPCSDPSRQAQIVADLRIAGELLGTTSAPEVETWLELNAVAR